MTTFETIQKIADLRNETCKLEQEIYPLIANWLKAKDIYFNDISSFGFNGLNFSVEYVIYGRWGGPDDTYYCEIPIDYFKAEDKNSFIANHTKAEKETQERLKAEGEARIKAEILRKRKDQYERLKAEFENKITT